MKNSPLLKKHLVLAADFPNFAAAKPLLQEVGQQLAMVKVGLQLFTAEGKATIDYLKKENIPFLLDLKLHDIPNTVYGTVKAAFALGARALTIHLLGGAAMIGAAVKAAKESEQEQGRECTLLAVTVLTSHDQAAIKEIGLTGSCQEMVERLAKLAVDNAASGLVCSPKEVKALREKFGPKIKLLVPGIRPAFAASDEQKRIATPKEALAWGASWLVIGRPITKAKDPLKALQLIAEELG